MPLAGPRGATLRCVSTTAEQTATWRRYGVLLAVPGARRFWVAGIVGRFPISTLGISLVLLVEGATGSYGFAGAVSATALVAQAAVAVLQGRWLDRFGQRRVLVPASATWALGLAMVAVCVEYDAPTALVLAFAAVAGAAQPNVGGCTRARWAHVLDGPADRDSAFALEAVADEVVFMTGPVVVTALAAAWHPLAGLVAAVVVGLTGALALAAQRATEPPAHRPVRGGPAPAAMPWGTVLPLAVAMLCLGSLFGAAEVATVALAAEQGAPAVAGVLLALWATGSLVAGLVTGALVLRRHPLTRTRLGALALTVAMSPLIVLDQLWLVAPVLLVGGLAIAPTLIAIISTAEQAVPSSRLTEGLAVLQTGIAAGVAPGSLFAGLVVDARGAHAAYVVCVVSGALALLATLPARR